MSNSVPERKHKLNKTKSAIVIGGAGFLGSVVCEELLSKDIKVYCIDNLSEGSEKNLKNIVENKAFTLIKAGIDDINQETLPDSNYILYLAGANEHISEKESSLNAMISNASGLKKALDYAKNNKVPLTYISSTDVYNGILSSLNINTYFGTSERDLVRYSLYEAKRYAESLIAQYVHLYNLNARIVRLSEVYGPKMDTNAGTEIAQLINNAINTDELTVNGDGLKLLHPIFVTDAAIAIINATLLDGTNNKIYNVLSDDGLNVLNIAHTIQKNSTKSLKISFSKEYAELKFPNHEISNAQAKYDLKWKPTTNIDDGITQTLEFFFLKQERKTARVKEIKETDRKNDDSKYVHVQNLITKNSLSIEKKQQEKVFEDKKQKSRKINVLNASLLATSGFIILLLFVFPTISILISNDKALKNTSKAVNAESSYAAEFAQEAEVNAENSEQQYSSLEWLTSMLQQREKTDSFRELLRNLTKFNRVIINSNEAQKEINGMTTEIINGQRDKKANARLYSIVNESITLTDELSTTPASIWESAKNSSFDINKITEEIKKQNTEVKKQSQIIKNAEAVFQSIDEKNYLILLQNKQQLNIEGGKIIGYLLIKTNQSGVQSLEATQTHEKSINETIVLATSKEINNKFQDIMVADSNALINLIKSLGGINNRAFGELITELNVETKIYAKEDTSEQQLEAWKSTWTKLKEMRTGQQKVRDALTESIKISSLRNLNLNKAGNYANPACGDNTLKSIFGGEKNGDSGADQKCIQLYEDNKNIQLQDKIKRTLTSTYGESGNYIKAEYSISNNSDSKYVSKIIYEVPEELELSNIEVDYPISFDKVSKAKIGTSYINEIEIEVPAKTTKKINTEWKSENKSLLQSIRISRPL